MTETARIILGMSDAELWKFYELGGRVPHGMLPRVQHMLDGFPPRPMDDEREGGRLMREYMGWRTSEKERRRCRERMREKRRGERAELQRRVRYARENLIGRRLPSGDESMDVEQSVLVTATEAAA